MSPITPVQDAPRPRLLVVNSNTNPDVTARVVATARAVLPEWRVTGATAAFGPHGIGGRADIVISAAATLEAAVAAPEPFDALMVACFSDPGLAGLREILDVPVVGIAEAAFLTALQLGARFSVVTVGPRVVPIIEEAVRVCGLSPRFGGVVVVDRAVLDAPDKRPLLREGVARAVAEQGAEVAVLGGAAFAGEAAALAESVDIPVVGGVEAAAAQALALTRLAARKPRIGSYAAPVPKAMTGLSQGLARKLALGGAP